jgi:aspartate/glutamate racemase
VKKIGMLIRDGDAGVPFFDTTQLHAQVAVDAALA